MTLKLTKLKQRFVYIFWLQFDLFVYIFTEFVYIFQNNDELNSNVSAEDHHPALLLDDFSNQILNKKSENIPWSEIKTNPNYKCNTCNICFVDEELLERHRRIIHRYKLTKMEKSSKPKHFILPNKPIDFLNKLKIFGKKSKSKNSNPNVEKRKRCRKTPHLEVRKKICMFHMKKCERNIFSSPAFVEKLKHVIGKKHALKKKSE